MRHFGTSRRPPIAAFVLALNLVAAPAAAATIPAKNADIVEVTVYRDRAEIVRRAAVSLPAGPSAVAFAGIPFRVEPDSLRVSAEGVPSTLGAVELRDRVEEPEPTPEWIAARDAVRDLEQRLAALEAAEQNARKLRGFLDSVSTATAQKQSRDLAEGRADPAALEGVYELLRSKHGALSTEELERARRRAELREELELARARLATLQPERDIRSRVATVEVEAARAGSLTLRLAYLVSGASWRPAYRASLDAESGELHLTSEAVVRQATGEDWNGVDLRLSTAAPARGVEPPMLGPWLLRPFDPRVRASRIAPSAEADAAAVPGRMYQRAMPQAPMLEEAEVAGVAESGVVHSAFNVAFTVPGGSDVPADSSDHRVTLRQERLPSEIVYRSVPGLDASAYLTAKTNAPEEYPILAGPVRVFAGGAYLGAFLQQETGPGAELTIPFGVDNRLVVTRVPEPRTTSREGLSGKFRQIAYAFRTKFENLMGRPVRLVVEDRVPVAEDERIEVEVGKATSEGYKKSERRAGVLLWEFDLAPRDEAEILLEYTVRFPRDLVVAGIE